jgi:hypothetical protein
MEINNKPAIAQTAVPDLRVRKQAERMPGDLATNTLIVFMDSFVVIEGV